MFESLKAEYRSSLKSSDTEENIDLAFYRPIGFAWACLFRKLGITPNAVTIASIFIGVAAGICFYPTDIWINLLGMLLLIWANSYDSADGQLARLTKQYSRLGRILDGASGDFWFASIYIAIALRTNATVPFFMEHQWIIWAVAVAAGLCHAKQAATADYYRQFHLFFLKGAAGSELDSSAQLKEDLERLKAEGASPFRRIALSTYYNYTRQQEQFTPAMQRLRDHMRADCPDGQVPEPVRQEFLRLSFPLCKWENFMTFNWRTIFLFVSLLAGYPWLYFAAELTVFNAVLLMTRNRHERLCATVLNSLKSASK